MLASPSRLDLSFVVIGHNPGDIKTVYTSRLPPLPIRIDYSHSYGTPTNKDVDRVLAALKHCDLRVRGIVFNGKDLQQLEKVFKEMKRPFPALERLEISTDGRKLQLPPTFLKGSASRLRCLKMFPVSFKSISRLLSSATALVELFLSLDTIFGSSPMASLSAYLQAMPCLRWLALKLHSEMSHNDRTLKSRENGGKIAPLSQFTFLHFYGHRLFLTVLCLDWRPSHSELSTFNCMDALTT